MGSLWHAGAMQLLAFRDVKHLMVNLGWHTDKRGCTGGYNVAGIRGVREDRKFKGNGFGWLLVGTLEKDNEKLRVINHQLKAKYESQRESLAASKKALSPTAKYKLRIRPRTCFVKRAPEEAAVLASKGPLPQGQRPDRDGWGYLDWCTWITLNLHILVNPPCPACMAHSFDWGWYRVLSLAKNTWSPPPFLVDWSLIRPIS